MKRSLNIVRNIFLVFAILAILAPSYFRTFDTFELGTLDIRYRLRPVQPQSEDIAIIQIAEDTLEKIGRWPFTRNWHAAIIDILSDSGAKAVIFDILFAEPSEHDGLLVESTKKAGNVYYVCTFDRFYRTRQGTIESTKIDAFPLEALRNASRGFGFINFIPDKDGKTRRTPLKTRYDDNIYYNIALLAAADYLKKDVEDIYIPADEDGMALINFAGRWHQTYKHYSYIDIIKSYSLHEKGEKGAVNLSELRGKVCFIGLTATAAHDTMPIPQEGIYPGLGVHINLFNSIVTDNFLTRAHRLINLLLLMIFGALTAFVALKARPVVSSVYIVTVMMFLCAFSWAVFAFGNLWIDLFYPIVGLLVIYLSLTFYKYLTERQKRQLIEKELEVASKIQMSFLPQEAPGAAEVSIVADMVPAKHVGGDLYDFVDLKDGKVGVMVGDVSGKGVPAALYMARAVSLFRLFSRDSSGTSDTLVKLNDALSDESDANLFVTLTYLIYDAKTGSLTYSSGGHNPTLLFKKGEEKCRMLETKEGMPIGLMPGDFSEEKTLLSKGDVIILYSDGVTEAMSRRGEEYGEERLIKVVENNKDLGAQGLLLRVKESIAQFAKSAPQHDDITIIVMEVK